MREKCLAQAPSKIWDKTLGSDLSDNLSSIVATDDGGVVLAGNSISGIGGSKSDSCRGFYDYWIVKLDANGNEVWDKTYGGDRAENCVQIKETLDGGYIVVGGSNSDSSGDKSQNVWNASQDYWILRLDANGNKIWDKDFGGIENELCFGVVVAQDKGFLLLGISSSNISGDKSENNFGPGYTTDFWIVKIDSSGTKQWDRTVGGNLTDGATNGIETKDHGFIIVGNSDSHITGNKTVGTYGDQDVWILKMDSIGNVVWQADHGGDSIEGWVDIASAGDGKYYIGCWTFSQVSGDKTSGNFGGYTDYWVFEIDSNGNKLWDKEYGGTGFEDYFSSIVSTYDKGFIIGGSTYSGISGTKTTANLGAEQSWFQKADSLGNPQWDITIQVNGSCIGGYVVQSNNGCYYFGDWNGADSGGYKSENSKGPGYMDYFVLRFCDPMILLSASNESLCEKFCTNFLDQSTNNPTSWQWQFPGGIPSSSTDQNPTNICYNLPGIYDVTLITTNANGNDTTTLHNYITVYATPPFPSITQVGYTLTSSPANSYQWQINSADISGATNQSYTVLQTGYYTVIVGDTNGCVNSFTEYVLISGIDDVMGDANISVYPNPSSGNFIVEWLNGLMVGEVSIQVVNTLGQKVFSSLQKISAIDFKKEIDLSGIARGVYFIEIKTANEFVRKKILIAN